VLGFQPYRRAELLMTTLTGFDDLETMARTLWGEARGEPREGKAAVAHVILNRARRGGWFGDDVKAVCLKRWQFSCWLESDPNRAKLLAASLDTPSLKNCVDIALRCFLGTIEDPTGGADHYYNPDAADPVWARGKTPTARIGRHLFFRLN
jgi:spore germination cell wall hydrolase CwlJ-like protein